MRVTAQPSEYQQRILGYPVPQDKELNHAKVRASLEPFGLHETPDPNKVVRLPIPDNFGRLGNEIEQSLHKYQPILNKILHVLDWEIPEIPTSFKMQPGWNCWHKGKWTKFNIPPHNRVMFLDFETVEVSEGIWLPVCAMGLMEKGFICWLADIETLKDTVIPYGSGNIVINHNVSYDRSYLASEYALEPSENFFFDTQSAWVVTRGQCNQQRILYNMDDVDLPWMEETTTNGLAAVYEFYTGKPLDKGVRDELISQGLAFVKRETEALLRYCCMDVIATLTVFKYLYREYLLHRPHPVNQVAHLLLNNTWLPLSASRFPKYYETAEAAYQKIKAESQSALLQAAQDFMNLVQATPEQEWLPGWRQLDWSLLKSGKNKGLPRWFADVRNAAAKNELTMAQRASHIILGHHYQGFPIYWENGWRTEEGYLPHPDEKDQRVTNVFIKGMVKAFEAGIMTTSFPTVAGLLADKMKCINWVSLRKRVAALKTECPDGFPVVLPRNNPNGTVTGRMTDAVWQVASNPKPYRVGTELKSMVEAPPGWLIVGADVDSEEADLAGWIGDSVSGLVGSCPFSFISIVGDKKNKTDIHSILAASVSVNGSSLPRDVAKSKITYGTLYGQGKKGTADGLYQELVGVSYADCEAAAVEALKKFKGEKVYGYYRGGLASEAFNKMESIANKDTQTPLFKAKISRALSRTQDYKTTRVNWVIQSSGVDFRDLLVLLAEHFFTKLNVEGRLLLTIHDEIRCMVKEGHETRAAWALQLAHIYTRYAFIDALGLDYLPARQAWFSSVDIDYILRKEPKDPQVTPTQDALAPGKGITAEELADLLTRAA
jgi:DNA polymerase gamma 1